MAQPTSAAAAPAPAAPAKGAPPANETKAPDNVTKTPVTETKPVPGETEAQSGETAAQAKKPANQIEADLAAQFEDGEWENLPQKVRDRMVAAEMKSREADKRMQLAAKLKKDLDMTNTQVSQLIDGLRKDPWRVLSNPALGHDVRKLAEEYVWQMIQEQRMTPEQREAAQTKLELAQMKAQQEQAKKDQADREMEALVAQRRAYWEKTIPEAIDAAGLPKTSYTVRRFVDYIRAAARSKVPADMPAIADQVKQELVALQGQFLLPQRMANETDESYQDRVLSSAPNEYVRLLRKADLRKLRAKGLAPKPGPKPGATPGQAGPKKMSMSEWLNARDQRMGRAL